MRTLSYEIVFAIGPTAMILRFLDKRELLSGFALTGAEDTEFLDLLKIDPILHLPFHYQHQTLA